MSRQEMSDEEKAHRINLVVNHCRGIVPQFEAFYLQSILYAAKAADDAFERFARAVVKDLEAFEVMSSVQEALTHSAGLSRFFWPARKGRLMAARATRLRAAFNMDDSALEQRGLRNALEHFDERLDEFLLFGPTGYFFPSPMVDNHKLADEAPGQIFRLVDPFEFAFAILGEKYEFLSTREEVRRLLKLALQFDDAGSRFPLLT